MRNSWQKKLGFVVILFCLVGIGVTLWGRHGEAQGKAKGGNPITARYSVIATEGTNLIVTDNKTHMLYFYVVDRDAAAGAELKLRGHVDLTQVGQTIIKPKTVKKR